MDKWQNLDNELNAEEYNNAFRDWVRKIVQGWRAETKAVDDLSLTKSTLTEAFKELTDQILKAIDEVGWGSCPGDTMTSIVRFFRKVSYCLDNIIKAQDLVDKNDSEGIVDTTGGDMGSHSQATDKAIGDEDDPVPVNAKPKKSQ